MKNLFLFKKFIFRKNILMLFKLILIFINFIFYRFLSNILVLLLESLKLLNCLVIIKRHLLLELWVQEILLELKLIRITLWRKHKGI